MKKSKLSKQKLFTVIVITIPLYVKLLQLNAVDTIVLLATLAFLFKIYLDFNLGIVLHIMNLGYYH